MKDLATAYDVIQNPNASESTIDTIASLAKECGDDELLKLAVSHPNVGTKTLLDNC